MSLTDQFPCPLCEGKCEDITENLELNHDALKCMNCGEFWQPAYIRGFWAGFVKGKSKR